MKLNNKHNIYFGIYGIYCLLATLFFNPHYSNKIGSILLYSLEVAILSTLILFTLIHLSKKADSPIITFTLFSLACLFVPLISALLLLPLGSGIVHLIVFCSTFIVIGILPASLIMLWFVFNKLLNQPTIENKTSNDEPVLQLKNELGKVVLTVKLSKTICFEANDNYVITYYISENEQLKKSMNRISLKKIEDLLTLQKADFHRLHKSFIVNSTYIEQLSGKSQNYSLKMKGLDKTIPISRAFDVSLLNIQS